MSFGEAARCEGGDDDITITSQLELDNPLAMQRAYVPFPLNKGPRNSSEMSNTLRVDRDDFGDVDDMA